MIKLKCGCEITDDGIFIIGAKCLNCIECNAMPNLHPFGSKRFVDL